MCGVQKHRGPDEEGMHFGPGVGLGHRRLSIIDLSSGQQPMGSADGKDWLVFNGEIYNFQGLRDQLKAKGHVFRTKSDTEVILVGYREWGDKVVEKLSGMFAFALWDGGKKRLLVARDRMGKKPLYFADLPGRFLFASEMKSILCDPETPREVDPEAVDNYFSFGYIPAPLTIFKAVRKLRPGHYLTLEEGRPPEVRQYWDVRYAPSTECKTENDFVDKLEGLLKGAVERRLVSEVPLGAFLSGGLDSSVVVGTMAKIMGRPVKTFTIDFAEQGFSESADARLVADTFKTDHKVFTVKSDAIGLLPDLVWHFDEPFADSSAVPTYYVSKMARQEVTVVLSGDGGDELFAGYNDYAKRDMLAPFWRIPSPLRRHLIGPLGRAVPVDFPGKNWLVAIGKLEQYKAGRIFDIFPLIKDNLFSGEFRRSLKGIPAPGLAIDYWKNLPEGPSLSRAQYADTKIYLPEDILMKVDRMSMACSLETRAPLLDYEIAEFAASIPPDLQRKDGRGKYVLRQAAKRFLPEAVLNKKKQGFAIPRDQWFRGALQDYAEAMLRSEKFRSRGYFDPAVVDAILASQRAGKADYGFWIWALINFELWHQVFLDKETRRI